MLPRRYGYHEKAHETIARLPPVPARDRLLDKKICGRFHYFAPWGQPDEALTLYRKYADDLHNGRITKIPKSGTERASISQKGRGGKPRPKKPYEPPELVSRECLPAAPTRNRSAGNWPPGLGSEVFQQPNVWLSLPTVSM